MSKSSADLGDERASERLRVLLVDYAAKESVAESKYKLLVQITSIAFGVFGVMITYFLTKPESFRPEVIWFLPLALTVPIALCFEVIFDTIFIGYYLRDLEDQISTTVNLPFFHYHRSSARALSSPKTGMRANTATYLVIILAAATFYVTLIWYGFSQLPRNQGSWFLLAHCLILGVLFGVLWITFRSLRGLYEMWKTGDINTHMSDARKQSRRLLVYFLMPRPMDMVLKGATYLGCFLTVIFVLPHGRIDVWFVIVVFVCVDLLAKQTTYIWNDTIDYYDDRKHPDKSARPLARSGSRHLGKVVFLWRFALAAAASIIVAKFAGAGWLLALVVSVFAWQAIYDHWAKKHSDVTRLASCSLGYSERALAGLFVAFRFSQTTDLKLAALVLTWVVACAFLVMATSWRAEREKLEKERQLEQGWFTTYGRGVARTASLALLPVSCSLVFLYGPYTPWQNALLLPLACLAAGGTLLWMWRVASLRTRGPLGLAVIAVGVSLWFGQPAYRWMILALGIPMFFVTWYANATYDELSGAETKKTFLKTVAKCNVVLFGKEQDRS